MSRVGRLFFSKADGRNAAGVDPQGHDKLHGGLGPFLPQGQVILRAASFVAVTFDQGLRRWTVLQPFSLFVQYRLGGIGEDELIKLEENILIFEFAGHGLAAGLFFSQCLFPKLLLGQFLFSDPSPLFGLLGIILFHLFPPRGAARQAVGLDLLFAAGQQD